MSGYHYVASKLHTHIGTILLSDYVASIRDTDVLPEADLGSVLLGLYGEVGGIMSTVKKHVREGAAYPGFRRVAEEEFGDTLWYFSALCRRTHFSLDSLFAAAASGADYRQVSAASDLTSGALAQISVPNSTMSLDLALFELGKAAASLLGVSPDLELMRSFARAYLTALQLSQLSFAEVARANVRKVRGAFLPPERGNLVDFDAEFDLDEQLPRVFRVKFKQRTNGKTYLQWNDVFIGDPLSDNIHEGDGYRFHDVFHFAYVAILHWSPVIRALIKHKRKSKPSYDESQDGGRAIVVEEGLTAWIFARAKELHFFEGQDRVSLGLLKIVEEFVTGYEVSECPLKLWERAILEGYNVFRQIRSAEGGWVVGNRSERTLVYEPF